jgi:hypothetical protein
MSDREMPSGERLAVEQEAGSLARKPYQTPVLVECGPVSALTLGLASGPNDGLGGLLN